MRVADDERTSWAPVDLTAALAGHDVEPPSILTRSDGFALLYPGRTHQFAGESESCKSWAALAACAQVLGAGGRVLWIDYEDDERGIVARLRSLLVPVDVIAARFVYVRPDEALMTHDGRATAANTDFAALIEQPYVLAVIDGVTEALVTEGFELNSNTDVAKWSRLVPKRIATTTGAATVAIDHVTKSAEGRGRYAIGGQHKLAGLTGAAYRFDVQRRFARAIGAEPVSGVVAISVSKDRPGHIRGRAIEDRVGTFELTSYPDGAVSAVIRPAGDPATSGPEMALVQRIIEYLDQYQGASKLRIETDVEGRAESIRAALRWMAHPDRAWLLIERVGSAHRHHLTDAGREVMT